MTCIFGVSKSKLAGHQRYYREVWARTALGISARLQYGHCPAPATSLQSRGVWWAQGGGGVRNLLLSQVLLLGNPSVERAAPRDILELERQGPASQHDPEAVTCSALSRKVGPLPKELSLLPSSILTFLYSTPPNTEFVSSFLTQKPSPLPLCS